jgi:hypothetical protein
MVAANLGQILALVGFVLLLLNRVGARRGLGHRPGGEARSLKWQRALDLAACGFMAAGLLLMWAMK